MATGSNREEAERWLITAEKVLSARDFHSARTFAIRARESDPRFDAPNHVLAVADTIIAAESVIVTVNGNQHHDWYAILQLARFTQSSELIATQFHKLALLLNPDRNRLPYSDLCFKLVTDAWSVLSNPSRKLMYDTELQLSQFGERARQTQMTPPPAPLQAPQAKRSPRSRDKVSNNYMEIMQEESSNLFNVTESTRQARQILTEPTRLSHAEATRPTHAALDRPSVVEPARPGGPVQPVEPARLVQPVEPARLVQPVEPARLVQPVEPARLVQPVEPARLVQPVEPARPVQAEPARPIQAEPARPSQSEPARPSQAERACPSETESEVPSFWTACPYCYVLYEYPKAYEDCTLRCQNCKRAFHGVMIASPPVTAKDTYFCCWGFFPVGYSGNAKQKGGNNSNWTPVSPMFSCPMPENGKSKQINRTYKRAPVLYDEVLISDSESDPSFQGSDDEWGNEKRRKKVKNVKGKGNETKKRVGRPPGSVKKGNQNQNENETQNRSASDNAEGVVGTSSGSGSRVLRSSGKKQMGNGLDLNVEFSNELEDPVAPRVNQGNGEEDNIDGVAFFEGLDEFLSSLPILNVVKDDKVKSA